MTHSRNVEGRISAWFEEEAAVSHYPDRLLNATFEQTRELRQARSLRWRTFPMFRSLTSLAAAGAAVVVIVVAGALGLNFFINQQGVGGPTTTSTPAAATATPTPTREATASASTKPSPTAEAGVRGWPGNRGSNEPGLYSWDGSTCEPTNCVMGALHNHGSYDVRFSIERISEPTISDASATPVTVAGHEGLYLRISPRLEEWNVDFDGTLLSISLSTERSASQADVDEAHSIIESLVYEQRDTPLGFRLVFSLPSSHWDSPF